MAIRTRIALLSAIYLTLAGAGTWVAVARDLPGRPFGVSSGLPVVADFLIGLGTALSAPLLLLVILVGGNLWLQRTNDARALRLIAALAIGFLIGMLSEPILLEAVRGRHDILVGFLVAANIVVPLALLTVALGSRSRVGQ